MIIPTEPISSIPRPPELLAAAKRGDGTALARANLKDRA
jgi:hypothetical protein